MWATWLPNRLEIVVQDSPQGTITYINETQMGDPLTDNNYKEDGYRFHDIFHIVFATHAGWSPVLFGLMRKKWNLGPKIYTRWERTIEECIVAMTFIHATKNNLEIAPNILEYIENMLSRSKTANIVVWEDAIKKALGLWYLLYASKGGSIVIEGGLDG